MEERTAGEEKKRIRASVLRHVFANVAKTAFLKKKKKQ